MTTFMHFRLHLLFASKDENVSEPDNKGAYCGFVPHILDAWRLSTCGGRWEDGDEVGGKAIEV